MDKLTQLKMKTISIINDFFVPLGLKPIEDLPQACPKDGRACVLAVILQQGNPNWDNVFISGMEAHFNKADDDQLGNRKTQRVTLPVSLQEFITDFDRGEIPELVDLEAVDDNWALTDPDGKIMLLHKVQDAGIDIGNRLQQEVVLV